MIKRIMATLAIIFSVIIPSMSFDIPKPTATIKNFDIASITLRDITFLFNVTVKNPYPIALKLQGVKLKFSVEGKQFFETETSKGFSVKAKGEADNIFTVNLKYADIIAILKDYSQKEYLGTVIDTEIVIPVPQAVQTPVLPKSFSFRYSLSKKIPALKPNVSVANFSIVQPTLAEVASALKKSGKQNIDANKALGMFTDIISGKKPTNVIDPASIDLKLKVNFDIELKNDSKAKLSFSSLNYDFAINASQLVKGDTTKIGNKGDKQVLTVSNEFSTRSLAGPVLDALKNRRGAFLVKGNTFIKLPDEIKKEPVKLSFSEGGNFDIK
jgi:LEA14-like dessication related protein